MNVKVEDKIKVVNEVTVPIMPPVMYGRLVPGKSYEVNMVDQGELELVEINENARQHIKIQLTQLNEEIENGSVELIK